MVDPDIMIADFKEQLRIAGAAGWDRTRPHHHRAILAALRAALVQRQSLVEPAMESPVACSTSRATEGTGQFVRALKWAASRPSLTSN